MVDLLVGSSCLFHKTIALRLLYGVFDEALHSGVTEFVGVGSVGAGAGAAFLPLECGLEHAAEVFVDSFFGILLHPHVDGGVDPQSVGVEVVVASVRFGVL